jgi:hypothetical protein
MTRSDHGGTDCRVISADERLLDADEARTRRGREADKKLREVARGQSAGGPRS